MGGGVTAVDVLVVGAIEGEVGEGVAGAGGVADPGGAGQGGGVAVEPGGPVVVGGAGFACCLDGEGGVTAGAVRVGAIDDALQDGGDGVGDRRGKCLSAGRGWRGELLAVGVGDAQDVGGWAVPAVGAAMVA